VDVLLNWLIQGACVALAAAAGLRIVPAARAQARYGIAWTAYLLVIALPIVPAAAAMLESGAPGAGRLPVSTGPVTIPSTWWTSSLVAAGLWLLWSSAHAARLVADGVAVRRARRDARECPRDVAANLPCWSRVRAIGRPTRIVISERVRHAAVLGCGSPVIALAPDVLSHLHADDLDRVLVHEWAHVQRRDDVAQLMERIMAVFFGWHPAAWWLERQLDFEREVACDQLAVELTGSARRYATCLTTLAALPHAPVRPVAALAVAAPSQLHRRIVRILARPVAAAGAWRAVTLWGAVVLGLLTWSVSSVRLVASATALQSFDSTLRVAAAVPESIAVAPGPTRLRPPSAPTPRSVWPPASRSRVAAMSQSVADERQHATPVAKASAADTPPGTASGSELVALPSLPVAAGTPIALAPARADRGVRGEAASVARDAPQPAGQTPAPWTAVAGAGITIGRVSQNAGAATAGFFSRFGKTIGRSF
jgi:beta-lactamase regulating signal transducer with metallopeptidase domain